MRQRGVALALLALTACVAPQQPRLYAAPPLSLEGAAGRSIAFEAPRTSGTREDARAHGVVASWTMPPRAHCTSGYSGPFATGRLDDPAITEASGVTASQLRDDVVWVHNDSGDSARLFAVRTDGHVLARLVLPGVAASDFEDIASAPCPDRSGPCLWVADTGNNAGTRRDQTIYVVPEPDLGAAIPRRDVGATRVWRFPVTFPGPAVDAEAIAVSPTLDALYLFEKVDRPSARVFRYRAPFNERQAMALELVAEVSSPGVPIPLGRMITGAALHPDGTRLLLRVYSGIFEYRFASGQTVADLAAIQPLRVALGPLSEPQGEAVSYDRAGTGLWSVSEDLGRRPGQPLHHYACRQEGAPDAGGAQEIPVLRGRDGRDRAPDAPESE